MFSAIKTWIMAALGIVASVASIVALLYKDKADRQQRDLTKAALKQSREATKAVIVGQENEQKVENEKVDTIHRDYFDK